MEHIFGFIFFILLLGVAYFVGKYIEGKHYEELKSREAALSFLPAVTTRKIERENITEAWLVMGSVVISGDYFKKVLSSLINIFGGRVSSYETLIDRARRESLLRMKEEAQRFGADMVINMRFEMSKLDAQVQQRDNNSTGMFELLSYGTAVKLKK